MLGSHNTFSYLPLKNWWMYPFNFMAKCQNKTLGEQIDAGARYFDLRLKLDKKGNTVLAHGLMTYRENVKFIIKALDYFAERNDIIVRVMIEYNHRPKNDGYVIQEIIAYVDALRQYEARNLKFHQIICKWNEEVVKEYITTKELTVTHRYSSVLGKRRFWTVPFLYAKRHNKHFKEDNDYLLEAKDEVLMLDFI